MFAFIPINHVNGPESGLRGQNLVFSIFLELFD